MRGMHGESAYEVRLTPAQSARFFVVSGCSGGGKSTLLAELARRGCAVFEEPGRQVIREQNRIAGPATPELDMRLFVELTASRMIYNMVTAARSGTPTFFDRSIVDQVSGLADTGKAVPAHLTRAADLFRCNRRVFMLPPWPELFVNDAERTHDFASAEASYHALMRRYPEFGYETVIVPKADVTARADFVLSRLASEEGETG